MVANGASSAELNKWVGEFFQQTTDTRTALTSEATKYYGGEERIAHGSGNAMVIAFPGSSNFTAGTAYKPEISVLAALFGGQSSIKWSPGYSIMSNIVTKSPGAHATTTHYAYSDAGLMAIQLHGSAEAVRASAIEAIKAIKNIADGQITKELLQKAIAQARYQALEEGQNFEAGVVASGAGLVHGGRPFQFDQVAKSIQSVDIEKLKAVSAPVAILELSNLLQAAKALLKGKATVSAVGDLHVLPYAEEIGLNV